jgi:hypothetical protein
MDYFEVNQRLAADVVIEVLLTRLRPRIGPGQCAGTTATPTMAVALN